MYHIRIRRLERPGSEQRVGFALDYCSPRFVPYYFMGVVYSFRLDMSLGKLMTAVGGLLVLAGYMTAPEGPAVPIPLWWKLVTFGGFLLATGIGATVGAADAKAALQDATDSDVSDGDQPYEHADDDDGDDLSIDDDSSDDTDDDSGIDLSRSDLMHQ